MNVSVSFEFFPPKDNGTALWQAILQLAELKPKFVSVTYGAGGSTRDRTHALVKRIREETDLEPAAHLTCVNASRDEIRQIAEAYWRDGIHHIVALRGDAPESDGVYRPHPQGYAYADALVEGLKACGDFEISVAAYPEGHPEALSFEADLAHLKRKFEAGADQAITQYFFDAALFSTFIERARMAGITGPIHPGIIPIGNYAQLVRFSKMCGASIPSWVHDRFAGVEDKNDMHRLAVETAAAQCRELIDLGCQHLHFYTLNRPDLVKDICAQLQ